MSQITMMSGAVSGVRLDSSVAVNTTVTVNQGTYSGPSTASTSTVKTELLNFRVDNKAAYMSVAINLSNGDIVTVAGLPKGELDVLAVHNHTTKLVYWVPIPPIYPEIIYIVLGVCFTGFYGLGWLLIGGGILFLINKTKKINQIKEARAMVEKAPAPVAKAA